MRTLSIQASQLKPGMVLDDWQLEAGDDSVVAEIRLIKRPNYKYDVVAVKMKSGRLLPRVTTICKFQVLAGS